MSARLAAYSLLLGNFVVGAAVTAPAGMLNELAAGLDATVVEVGLLVTAGAVVLCLGSPITASLTSRLDRRTLLGGSALLMAVANLASAAAPNYWTLLVIRLLMLVAAAPFTPQAAGTIAMIVPEKERASAISFVFIGWSLSLALGLPIMGFLADSIGWRAGYAALGAAALVATALLYLGLPTGLRGAAMSLKSWGEIARNRRILLILSVTAIQVSGQFAIFTYLAPLITKYAGGTAATVATFFAAFGIAGLIGNIIASRIVGGLGALRTSLVFLSATALGCVVWAIGFGWIPAMFVSALLLGLGFAAINSMQQARLVAAAPPLASGSVALNTSCIYVGQAIGSGFGGLLFDAGRIGLLNLAAVVFVLAGMAILLTTRGPGEKLWTGRGT
jgi:predicted MFS family arabinose efflux permease